ncbi:post-transcriptional regulator [Metabacillus sp. FJAT-52054]|uniref:Post-transcriptional regulator n=1 Tax=Metabacillus sediminis TaxID=3117746 RepID=A0ABZ2NEQ2_9BACI
MEKHPAELYRHHVRPFMKSKLEEFMILGYDHVSEQELWTYLLKKKWKSKEELMIYKMVSDIMSVRAGEFMNFAAVESYKAPNWFGSEEGTKMLEELL